MADDKEDAVANIVSLKWRGQKDDVLEWYKTLKQEQKEAAAEEKKLAKLTKKKLK